MEITRRNRPIEVTDAPERRSIPADRVELRSTDDSSTLRLVGYASTFEEYEMYGGPEMGGWIERIDRHAFDKTLREKPDLHLLINHAGMPLARTKSGTLRLSVDDHGLRVEADLDRRDPEVQSLEVKMSRGDLDEMSFAFRVKAQEWFAAPGYEHLDDGQTYRVITELSLHKGDVSVVNWGANPTTHAEVHSLSDALKVIASADERELAEVRSEEDVINAKIAQEKLAAWCDPAGAEVSESRGEDDNDSAPESDVIETIIIDTVVPLLGSIIKDALLAIGLPPPENAPAGTAEAEEGREDAEEPVEEAADEPADEVQSDESVENGGMSLEEALALEGIDPGTDKLSLNAALALYEND